MPNPKKTWCVLFYIVAEPPPFGEDDKDALVNELVNERLIPAARDSDVLENMYVAYRVIYKKRLNGAVREVIHGPKVGREMEIGNSINTSKLAVDLLDFFEWIFPSSGELRCPAEHYAVCFVGHSFGPAGLFDPANQKVQTGIPFGKDGLPEGRTGAAPIGLVSLRENLEFLNRAIGTFIGGPPRPVDFVVYDDCWMSTLEIAYEVQTNVHFIVASQSLVPLSMWPYDLLFKHVFVQTDPGKAALQLTQDLGSFYWNPVNRAPNPTVPFAFLDVRAIGGVKDLFDAFVDALPSFEDRGGVIEEASIAVDQGGVVLAGDVALVDMMKLCDLVSNQPDAAPWRSARVAAAALLDALEGLVAFQVEAADAPDVQGFRGVSVFYKPSGDRRKSDPAFDNDTLIWDAVDRSFYQRELRFSGTHWARKISFETDDNETP